MPELLLIPVTHAITEVQEALAPQSEHRELSDAEVRELSARLAHCLCTGKVLVAYAQALGASPWRN